MHFNIFGSSQTVLLPLLFVGLSASARSAPINWDHLPHGRLEDLLVEDEGLTPVAASKMSAALRKVSKQSRVPTFILYAAIKQESDFQPYGVIFDYGNYSCSMSQFNIENWCTTFSKTAALRARAQWPSGISCDALGDDNAAVMGPFLKGVAAVHDIPESGTTVADIKALDRPAITAQMPGKTFADRNRYYLAGSSFATHCNQTPEALEVMATTLHTIYRDEIPVQLKTLHPKMAWILSDAAYNMGETAVWLIKRVSNANIWRTLTPQLYVDLLGKILAKKTPTATTLIFKNSDGDLSQIGYFQICVSQRHVTNITNASLPSGSAPVVTLLADDCEKLYPVAK